MGRTEARQTTRRGWARWGVRLAGSAVALAALLVGVEWLARARGLDRGPTQWTVVERALTRRHEEAQALGVDYLPREFALDAEGLRSSWGRCSWAHDGPLVLAMGDSTTRMVGDVPPGRGGEDAPALSWPGLLGGWARPGVQLCVIAEDGFHPVDHERFLAAVAAHRRPDVTVVLLCDNDLDDRSPRMLVDSPTGVALADVPRTRVVYPPLAWDAAVQRSAAFRALHRWLADRTGHRAQVANEAATPLRPADGLAAMARHTDALQVWYLPRLVGEGAPPVVEAGPHAAPGDPDAPPAPPDDAARVASLARDAGVPIRTVELIAPVLPWRRNELDDLHLSWRGQEAVARQIAGALPDLVEVPAAPSRREPAASSPDEPR